MSQVVGGLKECLEMGLNPKKDRFDSTTGSRETAKLMSSISICTSELSTPSAR